MCAFVQRWHRQIDVQFRPVQPKTHAGDFHAGELIVRRLFQSLGRARRKSETAPIGQLDDDPAKLPVVSRGGGARRMGQNVTATREGGVDLGVSRFGH
jgi:hypothetical protein